MVSLSRRGSVAILAASVATIAGLSVRYSSYLILPVAAVLVFVVEPVTATLGYVALRGILPDTTALATVFLVGGVAALVGRGAALGPREIVIPLGAYVALALVTVPLHPAPWDGPQPPYSVPGGFLPFLPFTSFEVLEALRLALLLVALLVGGTIMGTTDGARRLVTYTVAGSIPPIVLGLIQLATGNKVVRDGVAAIVGPFSHPNAFAIYLVTVIALSVAAVELADRGSLRRWMAVGVMVGGIVCLYATYTRSAWIAGGLILAVALARYRLRVGLAAAALACLLAFSPSLTSGVSSRFDSLSNPSAANESSWNWRTDQWEMMLGVGWQSPIIGTGFGTYERENVRMMGIAHQPNAVGGQYELGYSAHNDFVKSFVEMGALGVVLWIGVLVGMLRVAWSCRRHEILGPVAVSCGAGTLAVTLTSFSDNVQGYNVSLTLLLLTLGAVYGAVSRGSSSSSSGRRGRQTDGARSPSLEGSGMGSFDLRAE